MVLVFLWTLWMSFRRKMGKLPVQTGSSPVVKAALSEHLAKDCYNEAQ